MKKLQIGDTVRFEEQILKVTDIQSMDVKMCYVLETKNGKAGVVPSYAVEWNGEQFIYSGDVL